MRVRAIILGVAMAGFGLVYGFAQSGQEPAPATAIHVTGPLYAIRCAGQVHAVASIGADGVLLVDTGYRDTAEAVRSTLAALGGDRVRVIVNTHGDGDHVGGNALLGSEALIIAHPFARAWMGSYFALPAADDRGLPTMTLENEATLYCNGEAVRLIPLPGGHTGGDLVVHFTGSGVACIGDLLLGDTLPNADPARGGDSQRLAVVLRLLAGALPPETRVVAAHGRDADGALSLTVADLGTYAALIEDSVERVRAGFAAGQSVGQMQTEDVLARWAEYAGQGDVSLAGWTAAVTASVLGVSRPSICAPVTEALVAGGVEAALARYRQLRAERPDAYDFGERQLNALGYQLLQRERPGDAIAVFRLNVEAYPDSFNTHDSLGEAYAAAGLIEAAIAAYQRSIELNPDNANGKAALARLRAE